MNKNILLGVVILLVLVAGGGAFMAMQKSTKQPAAEQSQSAKSQTMEGTLKNLLTGGKSLKCTYTSKTASVSVDTIVYVANGKIRGDFTSKSSQTAVKGHMIIDGQYSYMWTDMSKQGFKVAIDQNQPTPGANESLGQSPSLNQSYTYSCSGWSVDASAFVLPSDITFSTMTVPTQSPSSQPDVSQAPSAACAYCDQATSDAAKTACRAQLHCQ